jgi:hypothetical protein
MPHLAIDLSFDITNATMPKTSPINEQDGAINISPIKNNRRNNCNIIKNKDSKPNTNDRIENGTAYFLLVQLI